MRILNRRRLLRCVAIALVRLAEWLSVGVPAVDAEAFEEHAFELERTQAWRYGYVVQRHGAVLVKTRLDAGATPLPSTRTDDEIAPVVARTLHLMPWMVPLVSLELTMRFVRADRGARVVLARQRCVLQCERGGVGMDEARSSERPRRIAISHQIRTMCAP